MRALRHGTAALVVGAALLYVGCGDAGEAASRSQAADAFDPMALSCRDLGLAAPYVGAPGKRHGKRLERDRDLLLARVTSTLSARAFGPPSAGSDAWRDVTRMRAAVDLACIVADSPEARPARAALDFAQRARVPREFVLRRNAAEYRAVVRLLKAGELGSSGPYVSLPGEYAQVAAGGWVAVNEQRPGVYFPVVLGVLDDSLGFAYWPSRQLPTGCNTFPGFCVATAERIQRHWFWVRMT